MEQTDGIVADGTEKVRVDRIVMFLLPLLLPSSGRFSAWWAGHGTYGPDSSFTESTQNGFQLSYTGGGYRGGGWTGPSCGGGRGGRGGGYCGRSRGWSQSSNPSPYPKPNRDPFHDVSKKFEQLQVSEEDSNVGINFDAYEDIPVDASGEDVLPLVNTFQDIDFW